MQIALFMSEFQSLGSGAQPNSLGLEIVENTLHLYLLISVMGL